MFQIKCTYRIGHIIINTRTTSQVVCFSLNHVHVPISFIKKSSSTYLYIYDLAK